jgi:hypothetical protein
MSKTLAQLESEFKTNEAGLIINPGKFEGESIATPFYYDIMLDGEGDVIEVETSDRVAFDLDDNDNFVVVFVDDNGFVSLGWYEDLESAENASAEFYNESAEFYNEEEY